jgi:hypothetical protein
MLPEKGLTLIDHEFSDGGYRLTDASARAIRALEQAGRAEAQKKAKEVCEQFFTQVKVSGTQVQ